MSVRLCVGHICANLINSESIGRKKLPRLAVEIIMPLSFSKDDILRGHSLNVRIEVEVFVLECLGNVWNEMQVRISRQTDADNHQQGAFVVKTSLHLKSQISL